MLPDVGPRVTSQPKLHSGLHLVIHGICSGKLGCNAHQDSRLAYSISWKWKDTWHLRPHISQPFDAFQTIEILSATDRSWYRDASCGCSGHAHNGRDYHMTQQSYGQNQWDICRQSGSYRLGCSSQIKEQTAHLKSLVGHWLEAASQRQPFQLFPSQHSEDKYCEQFISEITVKYHKHGNTSTQPSILLFQTLIAFFMFIHDERCYCLTGEKENMSLFLRPNKILEALTHLTWFT